MRGMSPAKGAQRKVIVGQENSGKTRALIQRAAETGAVIACLSRYACEFILAHAESANLRIPMPITYQHLLEGDFDRKRPVLIDDIDQFLGHLPGCVIGGTLAEECLEEL